MVGSTVQEGKMALQLVLILTDGLKFRCNLLSEKPLVGWRSLGAEQYTDAARFSDVFRWKWPLKSPSPLLASAGTVCRSLRCT